MKAVESCKSFTIQRPARTREPLLWNNLSALKLKNTTRISIASGIHSSERSRGAVIKGSGDRAPVEDTLRRISLVEEYPGRVIKHAESQTRPKWDQQSLVEMKRQLEHAGKEAGQGEWTDRFGFTVSLPFNVEEKIEWMKHFQDERLVFKGEVFESAAFQSIKDSE